MADKRKNDIIMPKEPLTINGKSKFTIEEYLAFEKTSTVKHEYYKGEIFLLHGAKPRYTSKEDSKSNGKGNRIK